MQLAFVLRDFKDVDPINIFFKFPVHYIDTAGLLEGAPVEGDPKANIQNQNKRTDSEKNEIVEAAFSEVEFDGRAKFSQMVKASGVSDKTLKKYIEESFFFEFDGRDVIRSDFLDK